MHKNNIRIAFWLLAAVAVFAAAMAPEVAFASTGGGGGMPWENPLMTVANSLRGPVAFVISLLGVVSTGFMLIFGGEINEFVRRVIMLVLVISLVVFASAIMSNLFGVGAIA